MPATLSGYGASGGIAVGPAVRLGPRPLIPDSWPAVDDPDAEITRVTTSLEEVAELLLSRCTKVTGDAVAVLNAEAMMARDPELSTMVSERIRQGVAAPAAVIRVLGDFKEAMQARGGFFADRAGDLDDLRDRVVALLLGATMPGVPDPGHPFILVADDLAPADTATLDPAMVLGLVTERGGPTSHTVILAKSLGIPAVINCTAAQEIRDGQQLVVDGDAGSIDVDPSPAHVEEMRQRGDVKRRRQAECTGPGRTADGHPVELLLNVGAERDIVAAGEVDAEGVGLFRTEFLFLGREEAPTVEQQQSAYCDLLRQFPGRKVVIRTLDAGADKPLAFVRSSAEPNPALGVRGFRVTRTQPELLDTQLTAVAQAAEMTSASVWVMAPMITTSVEAAEFVARARRAGINRAGVMIEVPAAALEAEAILGSADFLSIGTNDLAQYTMAADRSLGELAGLLSPWQPALLRLISMTAGAAGRLSKPAGVCGEAASDPLLALVLVGLGITSLSMAPSAVPAVRVALHEHALEECQELAARALRASSADEARAAVAAVARES